MFQGASKRSDFHSEPRRPVGSSTFPKASHNRPTAGAAAPRLISRKRSRRAREPLKNVSVLSRHVVRSRCCRQRFTQGTAKQSRPFCSVPSLPTIELGVANRQLFVDMDVACGNESEIFRRAKIGRIAFARLIDVPSGSKQIETLRTAE